jgi:hypothetical protein
MTFSPEEITDAQLEATFGFRTMTGTDPFAPAIVLPTLQAWRQASRRSRWQAEDVSTRNGGDPAHDLWAARQAFIDGLADQIALH